jgi:hypothetical protein
MRCHVIQSLTIPRGIIDDHLIDPYLLPLRLTGDIYLTFIQEILPELLEVVPLEVRREMWFQHDGAPTHFTNVVSEYKDETFGNRWIGRRGSITWPPRSPDLTPMDFFLCGQSLVYGTPVDTQHDLVARIAVAAATIREMPRIFRRIQHNSQAVQNMQRSERPPL